MAPLRKVAPETTCGYGFSVATGTVVGTLPGLLHKRHEQMSLQRTMQQDRESIAKRVFILDNSGSTASCDGHVLETTIHGRAVSRDATRWDEIRSIAIDQAEWNAKFGVCSEFILLNPPNPSDPIEGRDFFTVDPGSPNVLEQVKTLRDRLAVTRPQGTTPLAARLQRLRAKLTSKSEVRSDAKLVMLTIVTDGVPTNAAGNSNDTYAFVNELRRFAAEVRSFIIIRLATDEDNIVDYYNKLDEELELPLDILDDIAGEAKEVFDAGNGWLTYSPLIHRVREGGSVEKLFDLLDERPFLPVEIATMLESLLLSPSDPPLPRQPEELLATVAKVVQNAPLVYDGRTGRMAPPVDLAKLRKRLLPSKWKKAATMMKAIRNFVLA